MAETLAEAILRIRKAAGSHDKLAVKVSELTGGRKPTRAGLVTWENGTVPSGNYRDALIALGVKPSLFPTEKKLTHLARVEAEVGRLTQALAVARKAHAGLEERVAALEAGAGTSTGSPQEERSTSQGLPEQ